jgi:regulator of sirC expression with transglutaminase-like and TPR domain
VGSLSPRETLAAHLAERGEAIDAAYANLLVASEEYPDLAAAAYLQRLDQMARELRPRLAGLDRPDRQMATLNVYFFGELGFRGNASEYYDPRNSYLNEVLDRRLGLPITLSQVYVEVGRRLGLPLEGVGLPGHFLVRYGPPPGGLLVDPFNAGAPMTPADCELRLRSMYGEGARLQPEHLRAVTPRQVLARMLGNLKYAYLRLGDLRRTLRTLDQLLLVTPNSDHDRREREWVEGLWGRRN